MARARFVARLVIGLAGLAAAVGVGINANAAFAGGAPALTQSGTSCVAERTGERCASPFAGAANLAPGGAPATAAVVLTYNGSAPSRSLGLYFDGFSTRSSASGAGCTAADPGSKFDFIVSAGGRELYSGTLADFAAEHSDPAHRLSLPGRSGILDRWLPGDTATVRMTVGLDRSADNSYMGCSSQADFAWFSE